MEDPNVYECMLSGDELALKIKDESIFLVGESRVGKSTLFNYILGKMLKVVEDPVLGDDIYVCDNTEAAQVAPGFKSVTLLPNISPTVRLDGQDINISLQDMAGYKDTGRSFVGVFGVSYMLKIDLARASKSKFILAIEDNKIRTTQIDDVVVTFHNFINMLQQQYLIDNSAIAQKLFNSVSFVITKACKRIDTYFNKIQLVIRTLEANQNNSHLATLTLQLLRSILKNKRIELFLCPGRGEEVAPPCTILSSLMIPEKQWTYFDFRTDCKPEYIIKLPFREDFRILETKARQEIDLYNQTEQKKTNCIANIMKLLKQFVSKGQANWYKKGQIDYSQEFLTLGQIIAQNNPYGNLDRISKHMKMPCDITGQNKVFVNELELLDKLVEIIQASDEISIQMSSQGEKSKMLLEIRPKILELMNIYRRTFCQTKEEEESFVVFSFILWRSLYECSIMIEIDGQRGSKVFFNIQEQIEVKKTVQSLRAQFYVDFKPNTQNIDKFSAMLTNTMRNELTKIHDVQQLEKLYKVQIRNKIVKGDSEFEKKDYILSMGFYVEAMDGLKLLRSMKESQEVEKTPKDLDFLEFRLIEIMQKIGLALQEFQCYSQAVQFFKKSRSVTLLFSCYKKMIANEKDPECRCDYMEQFAELCQDYGRIHLAVEIYQKIIDEFIFMPERKRKAMGMLDKCLYSPTKAQNEYMEAINDKKRVEYDDSFFTNFKDDLLSNMIIAIPGLEKIYDNEEIFDKLNEMAPISDGSVIQ